MARQNPIGKTIQRQLKTPYGLLVYQFTPKRVKNMNIRIRSNGQLYVSASPRVPMREIERFLWSRSQWIFQAIRRMEARQQAERKEYLQYWGKEIPFQIQLIPSDKPERIKLKGEIAELSLWEDNEVHRRLCIHTLWKEEAVKIFPERFEFWAEWFQEKYQVEAKKIRLAIKPMTSRWGSYSKRTGTIALSLFLSSKPRKFLEYTIVHEFCHMIFLNHSPEFHALVEENLPGASEIRKKMKKCPI